MLAVLRRTIIAASLLQYPQVPKDNRRGQDCLASLPSFIARFRLVFRARDTVCYRVVLNEKLLKVAARGSFRIDSSHCLNQRSKLPVVMSVATGTRGRRLAAADTMRRELGGTMARLEMLDGDLASVGVGPAASDVLFELGMVYSVGRDVPVDPHRSA
jgi:hypothetical protein